MLLQTNFKKIILTVAVIFLFGAGFLIVKTLLGSRAAATETQPLEISFTQKLEAAVSGDIKVPIAVTRKPDKVHFKVAGKSFYKEYAAIEDDEIHYHFIWPTFEFPDDDYKVIAYAISGENIYSKTYGTSATLVAKFTPEEEPPPLIQPDNPLNSADAPLPAPIENEPQTGVRLPKESDSIASKTAEEELQVNIESESKTAEPEPADPKPAPNPRQAKIIFKENRESADANRRMEVILNDAADKVTLILEGEITKKFEMAKGGNSAFYSAWPAEEFPEGQYKLTAAIERGGAITYESADIVIKKENGDGKKQDLENTDKKEIDEKTEAEEVAEDILPECADKNIKTAKECKEFMKLPYECREKNLTKDGCDKMMALPFECREKNLSEEECDKLMAMPFGCKEKNIIEQAECERYLYIESLPTDCKNAGILTHEECNNFLFLKYLPPECLDAGAKNEEECSKILNEKTEKENTIAGVQETAPPLDKECSKNGITDKEECEIYIKNKHSQPECADAESKEECERIMFALYGPGECRKADIKNEQECKKFLLNKFTATVKCENGDEWECKTKIKEQLGTIAAKSAKFGEIKEKTAEFKGKTVILEDLEKELTASKGILPLQGKKSKFKIIEAKEEARVDENGNLIAAAPIALLFDSDEDGLADDMEKRINTNPFDSDSDGDGYPDGEEIKAGYNPLGKGKEKISIAPIDEAVLGNKPIGQPKTEGERSAKLSVGNIENISEEQLGHSSSPQEAGYSGKARDKGYRISGKAEPNSVITIYLYSDLPVVATAMADEYGNWQYELSESLIEGEHEIYVAINDNTGKVIEKSDPLNFFIKEAKAISVKDFISTAKAASVAESEKQSEKMLSYYALSAVFLIIFGIIIFIIFLKQSKG